MSSDQKKKCRITHIAAILDGNRRFSKKLMQEPWKGHEYGAQKAREFLEWCKEYGIKEATFYTFSMQNFNRPKVEFDFLMKLFEKEFKAAVDDKDLKNVKVTFIGRIHLFPQNVYNMMLELMERTRNNGPYKLNLAMAYGGREEIIDAVNELLKEHPEKIDAEMFSKYLYMESEPDLIIRTGGELRTSNFLPWQSTYSEWIFVKDKTWPEFRKEDFDRCIEEFNSRDRRFGK